MYIFSKLANVQMFIAHFPDFYGPNAKSTLVHHTLKAILTNKMSSFVGDKKIAREYIFTPDGAKAMVKLASHDEAYGQIWNITDYGVITGEEMIQHIRELAGYTKRIITVKRGMIQFIGLFDKKMKEFVEMLYLTEKPVVLSGEKYEKCIGELPKTSYYDGLKETIMYMKNRCK